jgi:glycosyltransferase involved in cell wall biosynthesis
MEKNIQFKRLNKKFKYKMSICMIVRDEEKFINNCLKSLKPLIDLNLAELIVVDTGSIDNTIEIVKKYTNKIHFKQWNNDFSEARNYSISLAQGEYIFIMDADQEMEYSEVKKLIEVFTGIDYKKYNTYSLVYKNFTKEDLSEFTYFSLNLIFKNDGYFKYEGKVHNQPVYKGPVKNLEIYMLHYGYIMTDDLKEKKFKRTATLLKKEIENDPENVYYIYQLSRSYEMHGDSKDAVIELGKYLSLMKTKKVNDSFKINYYHNATIIYFNAKQYDKCIYYCEKMKEIDKELIDCYYLMGKCNVIEGNIDEAVENLKLYLKYLKVFKYEKYASTNGLEVFSYGYKYKVISELLRLKIKIKQLEGTNKYIRLLMEDMNIFMLILGDILKVYIIERDLDSLNIIIERVKKEEENILLIYLLSKAMCNLKNGDRNFIISRLNILTDEEKILLNKKIENEEKSSFENLVDFIDDNIKANNKTIKVENCATVLIDTLNYAKIEEIINSNFKNEIIYIIKYLLGKTDMLINSYLIDQAKILKLLSKYELIIQYLNDDEFKCDKEFVYRIEEFRKNNNTKNIVTGISKLKEAMEIKNEFSDLIAIIKDSIILPECIEYNTLVDDNDLIKIKENLVILINNSMFEEATELFQQLEELYNIARDVDLLSIKSTLKFYCGEGRESKNILKDGLKYYHNNKDLLYNLGYIYETEKKYLSAMNTYTSILEVDSESLYFNEIDKILERLNKLVPII